MTTLYVSKGSTTDGEKLARIAKQGGWQTRTLLSELPSKPVPDDCAYYGEIDVGLRAAAKFGWSLLEPTFDLLASLPDSYLHRHVQLLTLGEARTLSEKRFVKPADCAARLFDADVYPEGRYIRAPSTLAASVPVLVSEPVVFAVEYRLFILNREIIADSPYVRGGWRAQDSDGSWIAEPDETASALGIGQQLLDDLQIEWPPAFTLDVGQIESGAWVVVEFNPIWCSGLLGAEAIKLLPALKRVCVKRNVLSDTDRRWSFRGDKIA